jgi:hypothetical protein
MVIMTDSLFNENEVLAAASAATGLDNFGDDWFREGLGVLLETYDRNVVAEESRQGCRNHVITKLSTRLKIQAAYDQHPEILSETLHKPMFVTGLPRTGTSALVNLLSADPYTKSLLLWEIYCPEPLPGWKLGQPDPRHDGMVEYMEANRNPEFDKIHYAHPDLPEECVMMHQYSFDGVQTGWEIMLEPYRSWFMNHDLKPLYKEYRDQLKLLQWQRPSERWVLKAPAHMWALPEIVNLFPDAAVVWGHRDVVSITSSISSMTQMVMSQNMWAGDADKIDSAWLGEQVMEWYALSLERGLRDRAALPVERFVDYTHDGFVSDSMATAASLYDYFDIEMTDEVRAALQSHIDGHPQGKHGKHGHKLEQFGLTEEQVRDRFAFYTSEFDTSQ